MNYQSILKNRLDELIRADKKACKILSQDITGHLEVSKQGNHYRYYLTDPSAANPGETSSSRTYLKKSEQTIAAQIASRDYASQFHRLAQKEIKLLSKLIPLSENGVHLLHENIHPGRSVLIDPLLLSDGEYIQQWMRKKSAVTNTFPIHSEIITESGESVRSKSEKFIADKLYFSRIPYKYEFPIRLNGKYCFPDFTILDLRTRKEIYWEHFGMIDNPDYRDHMLSKLENLARGGIVQGDNLITTFESKDFPLSTRLIDSIIRKLKM